MFNGKYNLNQTALKLTEAFGISDDRYKEIMHKLNAVANIYPEYVPILEVWLNCEEKFTDEEIAFGLFQLGKMFGMGVMMKKTKAKMVYSIGDPEGKLLKKMFEGRKELANINKLLMQQRGNN